MQRVQEGFASCFVPPAQKITSKMDVFYNPLMKENRDITVFFLNAFFSKPFSAASLMAGTGIREVRFLKEVPLLSFLAINDGNPRAVSLTKENLAANRCSPEKFSISCLEASRFLLAEKTRDYIDVDPFGSPNAFLDAAVRKCVHQGVLGITATDTAALSGTYPKATMRKYWAIPLRNHLMHEVGIRILLRKIQLIAAQYDKAAVPVFCYSSQHYYRVFVQLFTRKKTGDEILSLHAPAFFCTRCMHASLDPCSCGQHTLIGPLWAGRLWDISLAQKISHHLPLLQTIAQEALVPTLFFFDVHAYAKHKRSSFLPRLEKIIRFLHAQHFLAARTHFSPYGIRTNAPFSVIDNIFSQ